MSDDDSTPSIRLERVTKRFGDVVAVRDLTLDIRRGEFFTLLGPSGCGKTTTLRMIAGFEQPDEGRVLLDGVDVAGQPAFKRNTNTVFQSYALFPHLTVAGNVAFGLKRKRVKGAEVQRRVAEELERVGLADHAKRRPRQLSGGQQQRVALARALVNRPAVLLLDEPLGALDLKLRKNLQIELKRIQREVGITFIYVTHDQEEALTMSDRIAVMRDGVIEQCDPPEVVYDRPATTFVAGFIGVSNLMPASVAGANGSGSDLRLDNGVTVRVNDAGDLSPGQRCYAVVRPEKLRLIDRNESLDGQPSIDGHIDSTLYLGSTTQLVVRVLDGVPITVLVPNVDEAARARLPNPGDEVRLTWAPQHMHVVRETVPASKVEEEQPGGAPLAAAAASEPQEE